MNERRQWITRKFNSVSLVLDRIGFVTIVIIAMGIMDLILFIHVEMPRLEILISMHV